MSMPHYPNRTFSILSAAIRGTLGVDRDFGAGYVYKVILESSRLGN